MLCRSPAILPVVGADCPPGVANDLHLQRITKLQVASDKRNGFIVRWLRAIDELAHVPLEVFVSMAPAQYFDRAPIASDPVQ
jgi:hypothetical protein